MTASQEQSAALPARADVVVVGAGLSGLAAAEYVGGIYVIDNATVHPGRDTMAHLDAARTAGAVVIGGTEVLDIGREAQGFIVHSSGGTVAARDVLVASNGYTTGRLPWFSRRLSPIDAFMNAIAPGAAQRPLKLRDRNRTDHDTRLNSNYCTLGEDGRLIFGGRTGLFHRSRRSMAVKLRAEMLRFFPELADRDGRRARAA